MDVQIVGQPQRRKIGRGYREEVILKRELEPRGRSYILTGGDTTTLKSAAHTLKKRAELEDALMRENDEGHVLRLIDQIGKIEETWGGQGVKVRRKILWF